jgi:DNA-binding IclR family transcriptional regulator
MVTWSFLTNHTCAMVCIADDPGVRLRELAVALDITERSAYKIVSELIDVGYVIKHKHGRRNHYQIQGQLPLRASVGRKQTIGDILEVLVKARPPTNPAQLTLVRLRS